MKRLLVLLLILALTLPLSVSAQTTPTEAVNPNAKSNEDTRTPEEILDLIEAKGKEVAEALKVLRRYRD